MKKNKTMRLGLLLMALTLATSCLVSGTFAKYVVKGEGTTETARVAKFGVTITAEGDNAFSKKYLADDEKLNDSEKEIIGAYSVISVDDNVVAPGTKGQLATFTITGKPEVAVRITYTAEVTLNDEWSDGQNFYCPIQIIFPAIGDEEAVIDGTTFENATAFKTAIENQMQQYSEVYKARTNLSTANPPQISWEWPFSVEGNDAKDTYLGTKKNIPTITLKTTATVEQID